MVGVRVPVLTKSGSGQAISARAGFCVGQVGMGAVFVSDQFNDSRYFFCGGWFCPNNVREVLTCTGVSRCDEYSLFKGLVLFRSNVRS